MPRLRSALESIGLRRRREEDDGTPPREEQAPEPAPELEPEPVPTPELAVSGRSARAILASGRPPVLEPPAQPQPQPRPAREPERAPAALPPSAHEPQEWNIWELERLVRAEGHDLRQEEWTALVLSLRDFAQADGTLPPEFDELVRESFGPLLASSEAATEPAAMS